MLVEKILVRITIFVVSGREPKDIIISKGVTSLTVGEGTIGNYTLKGNITSLAVGEGTIKEYHLTLMPERGTSVKGITTPLAVGEGTIREYHLTLMPERETSEEGITTSHTVGEGTITSAESLSEKSVGSRFSWTREGLGLDKKSLESIN